MGDRGLHGVLLTFLDKDVGLMVHGANRSWKRLFVRQRVRHRIPIRALLVQVFSCSTKPGHANRAVRQAQPIGLKFVTCLLELTLLVFLGFTSLLYRRE